MDGKDHLFLCLPPITLFVLRIVSALKLATLFDPKTSCTVNFRPKMFSVGRILNEL